MKEFTAWVPISDDMAADAGWWRPDPPLDIEVDLFPRLTSLSVRYREWRYRVQDAWLVYRGEAEIQ